MTGAHSMSTPPGEWLDYLRKHFPAGSQVYTWDLDDPEHSFGLLGILDHIDDSGRFHTRAKDGSIHVLVIGEDMFSLTPPEPTLLKLYMPLTAGFYPRNEWGDISEDGEPWDGRTLLDYEDSILAALVRERMPEEAERGLMHWYHEADSVNDKVRSAVFSAEARDGQLWGVAECRVAGDLSPKELSTLKDYLTGQAADGWGEGFEQREIRVDGGGLYVHLWNSDNWSIQTGQERFGPEPERPKPRQRGPRKDGTAR